ncbi:MAG: TlpA family protein disulfide reductase [Candidatus Cloacimonetes bacterium]|nr:TlpA family protein disulfide reductase [Candidatus Cloacimonadota bacterium]
MKLLKFYLFSFFLLLSSCVAGPKVALVTGDQLSKNFQILNEYLTKKKYKVTVFDLSKYDSFPEQEVTKFERSLVIRLIEKDVKSSYMTNVESDFWQIFLSTRGSLVLFGDTLGDAPIYTSLFPDYVGFQNKKVALNNGKIKGVEKDLISEGLDVSLDFNGVTDEVLPFSNAEFDNIITHDNGAVLGVKKRSCSYKMSYFSFLPSWITDAKVRNSFFEKTFDWGLGFSLGVDMDAPDFPVLKLDGTESTLLKEFKDLQNVVVLEFMATWCSSCKTQLPRMVNLYNKYKDKSVSFYNVNYKENIQKVSAYLKEHPELEWPVSITENGLGTKKFGVKSLPGIFILDRGRRVKYIHKGIVSQEQLDSEIQTVLKENNFSILYKKLDRVSKSAKH